MKQGQLRLPLPKESQVTLQNLDCTLNKFDSHFETEATFEEK